MKNNFKSKLTVLLFLAFISGKLYSQEEHQHRDHHKYEFGIANSFVYFSKEKQSAYGAHLHFIKNIKQTKFGYGIGYERIFDKHNHNSLGLVGSFFPVEGLHLSLSPGIAFEGNKLSEANFALHTEGSYDFDVWLFHLGPLLEFAFDQEDYHFSFGLHLGYGF